jgi:hypothetical protein
VLLGLAAVARVLVGLAAVVVAAAQAVLVVLVVQTQVVSLVDMSDQWLRLSPLETPRVRLSARLFSHLLVGCGIPRMQY